MEEILDKLITEIKLDQRYIDYVEAEKKLHNQEIDSLLHEYQNKLNQYDELKKYNQYIDNQEITVSKNIKEQEENVLPVRGRR